MIRSRNNSKAVRSGQSGFTLIELAVALGVTAVVMLGILFLFDFNNKLTRVQSNVADMQQSLRIAQYDMVRTVRMAGRGGLAAAQGVVITRDVGDNAHLIPTNDDSPKILPGTDVLTVRGVFSTPIFQIAFTNPLSLQLTGGPAIPPTPATATGGTIEICALSPSGKEQDLESVEEQLTQTEALILVSPLDDRFYIVVALVPTEEPDTNTATCPTVGSGPPGIKIAFNIQSDYSGLSAPPAQRQLALQQVGYVGFLEEYRFYVREDHAIADVEESDVTPVLSRARFFPGTDNPYGPTAPVQAENLSQDIADGILDLQISLGFDSDNDGRVVENLTTPNADEWFGNAAGEAAVAGRFKGLRISTLVRTRRPDNTYEAPALASIEDRVYTNDPDDPVNGEVARKYRRRLLQTIVNLRNLTS